MPLNTGDQLGPYKIVQPLGEGGMGVMCRGRDARRLAGYVIRGLED